MIVDILILVLCLFNVGFYWWSTFKECRWHALPAAMFTVLAVYWFFARLV